MGEAYEQKAGIFEADVTCSVVNDKTIFVGLIAFVKENALVELLKEIWHKYWLQIIIGLIVVGAISSAIEKIGDRIHKN